MKTKRNTSYQFAAIVRVRRAVASARVPEPPRPTRMDTYPARYRAGLCVRMLLAKGVSFSLASVISRAWYWGRGERLSEFLFGAERAKQARREERAWRREQRREERAYAAQIRRRYPMVAELDRLYKEAQANA